MLSELGLLGVVQLVTKEIADAYADVVLLHGEKFVTALTVQ